MNKCEVQLGRKNNYYCSTTLWGNYNNNSSNILKLLKQIFNVTMTVLAILLLHILYMN